MSEKIVMTSSDWYIDTIKKPTRAKGFSEFQVGDVLRFSTHLEYTSGASGGGNYATTVTVFNVTRGIKVVKYQSELVNLLMRCYKLRELH